MKETENNMSSVYNPISTYRIQFNKEFTFADFEKIIPYLQELGIKTVYASPIFEASPGSMHGYDGTDPNKINPEIGTREQLEKISGMLRERGIGWLQDIVPNHLSFDENNKWLLDVLEKGQESDYADFFDIDWNHPKYKGRLMIPFPGSKLEETLKEKYPDAKHYVLVDWKETDQCINYRRFFTVNSLICTNIQNEKVFIKYHELVKELVDVGIFSGLRIDHVDGLYDPKKYLSDLRNLSGEKTYIVVEKILEPGEDLPDDWPIQGNSGYDFLGQANNLFTNEESEYALTTLYNDLTGDGEAVEDQILTKKAYILHTHMNGELDNLVRLYQSLEPGKHSDEELRKHIAEYLITCPVYRYYDEDYDVMKIDEGKDRSKLKKFYTRCMQFTGPLMAKGVEDTLMYTYNRFVGHNEVGDSPETFGYTIEEFHDLMQLRQKHWPLSLNATSTHDTKRGEDARARLNAMSDFYEEWIGLVKKWREENQSLKQKDMPDANDEYFIYQTLLATYPLEAGKEKETYPERLEQYLQKAMREAKRHSQWTEPNSSYEEAAIHFAKSLTDTSKPFWNSFEPFLRKIGDYGALKSFGQLVLKFTCPGVPDTYQGTELWDLSMVDPDNRRPVDYELRRQMLTTDSDAHRLWENRATGEIKLKLLQQLLNIRNKHAGIFSGEYIPLDTEGEYKDNIIAFIRRNKEKSILVSVQIRHTNDIWGDTKIILPEGNDTRWEDLLNGGSVEISNRRFLPAKLPSLLLSL